MTSTPDAPFDPEDSLGTTLARLRRAKSLTGRELARQVGMSQPKISRLENGVGLPDPADVARVARALGAPDDVVRHLVDLAEHGQNRMTDWRAFTTSLPGRQGSVRELESDARSLRVFQPLVIPGLLQTSEYARAVLASFQHVISPASDAAGSVAVAEAVATRVARQAILADPDRTFHFVMLEAVFESRFYPPEIMPAQITRIREIAAQGNVTISVIPDDARLRTLPMNGFELVDDELAVIDLLNTSISTRGTHDIAMYRQVFDEYAATATDDLAGLLDRHFQEYVSALQRAR
ncbi:helix-turn-helix domain-containing protein [Asanoa siamensis]|uniref:Transcriptional regulator n=1 Tax=Asanoa siamensis TaxID=926357 RepID=A0ABQ4D0S8_9ACTN|nr:helix-turn-helix transcriptional regulator [Asanoa siamensis]GIF77145.1 transcriptional regulator [Asanoa siamensis]